MNIQDIRFRAYLKLYNKEKDYVWLREDENGRYIEYAFAEGAPHDNRCLDWYSKSHSTYSERHGGWVTPEMAYGLKPVNKIYKLFEYACEKQNNDPSSDNYCAAGHACKKCDWAKDWRYDEPVKCACWDCGKIDEDNMHFSIGDDKIEEYLKILEELKAAENK